MKKALLLSLFSIVLISCQKEESKQAIAIVNRMDSLYSKVADIEIEQFKLQNGVFENAKLTEAIKGFEGLTAVEKANKIGDLVSSKTEEKETGTPDHHKGKTEGGLIFNLEDVNPINFDLAIKFNDLEVQQVKALNLKFKDLDETTLSAIAYYEKLSKDDKMKMFTKGNDLQPIPDYRRMVGRELQLAYNLNRLRIYRDLNRYITRRMHINEFPQGFRDRVRELKFQNNIDTEFDLPFAM